MKRIYILLCAVCFMAIAPSCNDNDQELPEALCKGPASLDLTGITQTDSTGSYNGTKDTTDWTNTTAAWTCAENKLFKFADTLSVTDYKAATSVKIVQYPNPAKAKGAFLCNVESNAQSLFCLVLVNDELNTAVTFSTSLVAGQNTFLVNTSKLSAGYYRMYYALYAPGKPKYYKGHGDIRII